jgi:hypothetical protein
MRSATLLFMFENRLKPLYPDIVIAKSSTLIFSSYLFILKEILRAFSLYLMDVKNSKCLAGC